MTIQHYLISKVVNPGLKYTIIADKVQNTNKVIAEAVFQKCDSSNDNGHAFPRKVLEQAINNIQQDIAERHFGGELDHPDNLEDINRISTVKLECLSHIITELRMDGNYVVGKFETLPDTPKGAILGALLREKIKVGVSIRATTSQDISYGTSEIDNIQSFELISYDAVHMPAYRDAYVKGLLSSKILLNNNQNSVYTMSKDELQHYLSEYGKKLIMAYKKAERN